MENLKEKLEAVLTKAENELQEVIVEAAKAGDYRGVDVARTIAVSIRELNAKISESYLQGKSSKTQTNAEVKVSPRERRLTLKRKARSVYPRFETRNDSIVKIGWSKKQRREYSHKVPSDVFEKTVKAMSVLAASSAGPFMAEQIIDKVNNTEIEAIPAYQVYVVIAMLRKTKCIMQIGREGYKISTDIMEKAVGALRSLKTHVPKS